MFTLNCAGKLLIIDRPLIMGIINATPDSFYAASRSSGPGEILRQAEQMIQDGADLIDIGGQSTRPGSKVVSDDEELSRILPGIEAIQHNFPGTVLSVDTYYSRVAKECVGAGACMINDVSSGSLDPEMIPTVAGLNVPYIIMHMRGSPQTMQQQATYDDITREVLDFFVKKNDECDAAGIKDLIIDPGFGFAKTIAQNFELLKSLSVFRILQRPLMVGLSRKSAIYKTLEIDPADALNGTTVLNTISLLHGSSILRVHDVKEARQIVTLLCHLQGARFNESTHG